MAGTAEPLGTAEAAVTLGLRVLTATEVAAVLRVDTDVITTAISNGELPGNRVGEHWRVEHGALHAGCKERTDTSPTHLRNCRQSPRRVGPREKAIASWSAHERWDRPDPGLASETVRPG